MTKLRLTTHDIRQNLVIRVIWGDPGWVLGEWCGVGYLVVVLYSRVPV